MELNGDQLVAVFAQADALAVLDLAAPGGMAEADWNCVVR
jgi:hypothetical protein